MALSNHGAYFLITIGCVMLVLTATSFICGCIAMSKLFAINSTEAGVGFMGLYFIAPGVLCILSGYKQGRAVLGATLATNTVGIVFAIACLIDSAVYWGIRNDDGSKCLRHKFYYDYDYTENGLTCSDLNTVRSLHGTITIVFAIFIIISFAGSIYGCVSTCCTAQLYTAFVSSEPGQPQVLVLTTANEPSQQLTQARSHPPPYLQSCNSNSGKGRGDINHARSNNCDGHLGEELVNV